jgi:glycosyltransferase involved in cell wall biosynthesis
VINQDWINKEIIVIDDGSTDTYTINQILKIKEYSKVKVITQANKGLANARNCGIREANGIYIIPLDSDDWLQPNAISLMLSVYKAFEGETVVYSDIKLLNGEIEKIKITYCNTFEQLFSNQLPYCMFFPKIIFDRYGGYDESLKSGLEDWDLNIRLISKKLRFVKLNEPIFNYNVSNLGMLKSQTMKSYASIWKYITRKYPFHYRPKQLYNTYRENKKTPSNRPLQIYIIYFVLSKFTSQKYLNFFIQCLYQYHSFLKYRNKSKNG